MLLDSQLARAIGLLAPCRDLAGFTGAGISVASGLPDYRGPQGLWQRFDPRDFAYQAFQHDPARYWRKRMERKAAGFDVLRACPNAAHEALVALERANRLCGVVTQNIDGLHQLAGNSHVVELHGSGRWCRCVRCQVEEPMHTVEQRVEKGELPPRCQRCGAVLKPAVIFFGEALDPRVFAAARQLIHVAEVLLVVGTSGVVQPAVSLIYEAHARGIPIVEVNREPTILSEDVASSSVFGEAAQLLPRLVAALLTQPISTAVERGSRS